MTHPVRVAVTGLGGLCAIGADVPTLWQALLAGQTGIGPITAIPTDRIQARIAAQCSFDPADHFDPRRVPLMDRATAMAVVAAREAMMDAGLDAGLAADPAQAHRRGVVLGAAIGQTSLDAAYLAFYGAGASRVHPLTVPRLMPNAAAAHVSMEFGLRGPCFATASACASATHAIGQALDLIRAGRADIVLAGGADASLVPGVLKAWEGLRILSQDGCRPFSQDRSGLVLGEGAAVLVLERWDHAVARGARIHAELSGVGMTADGQDLTAPSSDGAARAMQGALDDASVTEDEIGTINAHGTGTRLNDRTEAAAIHTVFRRPPPTSSSKGAIGHCLCAAGAIEAVITVMTLRTQTLPPTVGFRVPDPECAIDPVPVARAASIGAALSNSFAFGGMNASVLFRAVR